MKILDNYYFTDANAVTIQHDLNSDMVGYRVVAGGQRIVSGFTVYPKGDDPRNAFVLNFDEPTTGYVQVFYGGISFVGIPSLPEKVHIRAIAIPGVTFESLDESQTTGTAWTEKVSEDFEIEEAGLFEISWYAELKSSNSVPNRKTGCRVMLDTEILSEVYPNDDDYVNLSGSCERQLAAVQHTIKIEFCRSGGNSTAFIRRARAAYRRKE